MTQKPLQEHLLRHLLWLTVPLIAAVLFVAVTLISSAAYDLASAVIAPVSHWDPDQCFLLISVHHVFQAVIAFAVILLLSLLLRKSLSEFGFNRNAFRYSVRSVLIFSGAWFVIQMAASILVPLFTGLDASLAYPLTLRNFTGNFLFEILLSGTSEEILFRSMTIPLILAFFRKFTKRDSLAWGVAIAVATLVFTLAHINFNLNPFTITHLNVAQLITCVIFGVYYGLLMKKTGSVLGPMLAHNLLNGVCTLAALIITLCGA